MNNNKRINIPFIVNKINGNLIENNVRYIHWKSNIHLIDGLLGKTDLDILVHPDDRKSFLETIKNYSFIEVISPTWCRYPFIEDYIGCDLDTGVIIHLHVHYKMLTGFKRVKHFHIPWERQILSSRIIDKTTDWPTPSYVDEYIVFLLRMRLKSSIKTLFLQPTYPEHVIEEYRYLAHRVDRSAIKSRIKDFGIELSDIDINNLFMDNNDDELSQISRGLIRQIEVGKRYIFPITLLLSFGKGVKYWYARRKHRKNKLIRFKKTIKHNGLTVAFIGVDGSGKSTITREIYNWLVPKIDVHQLYLGSGDGRKGGLERVRSRIRKEIPLNNQRSGYIRSVIRSFFDALLLIRKTTLIWRSNKMARRGSVIIMDRFPQDQIFGIMDGPKVPSYRLLFLLRFLERLCFKIININKPDIIIRLNIDYDTSMHRKPDHDPNIIKEKIKKTKKINFGINTVDIDATQIFERVILEVKKILWKEIVKK